MNNVHLLIRRISSQQLILLFVLYAVANTFLLLNAEGIYWDDWTLYNQSYEAIFSQFSQNSGHAGLIFANIHYTLLSTDNGIFIYRILTFTLYMFTGYFIYKILHSIQIFNDRDRFWIVLIYLLAPLYGARIALIIFPYTLFMFIFFYAFYLLTIFLDSNRKTYLRIIVLSLFFLSFIVNSLLVYYAIVILFLFYRHYIDNPNPLIKNTFLFLYQNIDFILLPVIFYFIKITYFVPSGAYEGYNQIHIDPSALYTLIKSSIELSIYDTIIYSYETGIKYWYFSLFIFTFIYYFKPHFQIRSDSLFKIITFLLIGSLLFFLAVFPYLVVNKIPSMNDWYSRHQLLIPLSFAILIYIMCLFLNLLNRKIGLVILIFAISTFVTTSAYNYFKYSVDSFYQIAIQENMKNMKLVQDNTTFVVTMSIPLANHRKMRFYELNGIMKQAFNNDSRLFVQDYNEINTYKKYKNLKQYNFSSWIESAPVHLSIIANPISQKESMKLLYYRIINSNKFIERVKHLITINEIKVK